MRSKAQIKSHPLHPILVTFPIAFFTGAFVFDLIGWIHQRESLFATAKYLAAAGIGCALLAAVPGLIDFVYTVPPQSSGKTRAAKHGLTNISVVIIFAIVLFLRERQEIPPAWIVLPEAVAIVLLCIAGWMGGTLVYRNQIGVDPRYAGAGKWKEEYIAADAGPAVIASANELEVNQMKLLHIGDRRIVAARTEKGWVAFDDRCTHRGGSLAGGAMICGTVQCPWHGSQFDAHTGSVKAGPAKTGIRSYPLQESGGRIVLNTSDISKHDEG